MAKTTIYNQRIRGDAVIARLDGESLPAALKGPAKDFREAHRELDRASKAVDEARAARDGSLEAVAAADTTLDGYVEALADAMVGAGAGTRQRPFASFTKRSVSEIVALAYATEAKEVGTLCAAVRKKKPAPAVAKVVAQCEKQLSAVEKAIAGLDKPQAAYTKSLAKRDALLPEWTRKLARLKRHAAVAWEDDPELLRSTFAEPGAIAAPKGKRRKAPIAVVTPPANGATPAPPAAPSD